jgi:hypothetical protein
VTGRRTSRRRVALIATIAVAGAVGVLGGSGWAAKHWARNQLPGLVLADPTPELVAKYGLAVGHQYETFGPIVVAASARAASLNISDIREGDWFWIIGEPQKSKGGHGAEMVMDVEGLKSALARDFPSFPAGVRVVWVRGPNHEGERFGRNTTNGAHLRLSWLERLLYLP